MIDFHTHILPRVDDGSNNTEESLAMLIMERKQGIAHVVLSPHFYAGKDSVDVFLKRRQTSYSHLLEKVKEYDGNLPKLYCGAEVYYFSGIGEAEMVSRLCFEGTKILLLEMPFCQWDKQMLIDVKQLIKQQGLTLIIAHIERYYSFQKNKEFWNALFRLPVYAQINASSFLVWKKRRRIMQFLEGEYKVLLGSDCHNTKTRMPNLQSAREIIEKKMGKNYLQDIDRRAERILQK